MLMRRAIVIALVVNHQWLQCQDLWDVNATTSSERNP